MEIESINFHDPIDTPLPITNDSSPVPGTNNNNDTLLKPVSLENELRRIISKRRKINVSNSVKNTSSSSSQGLQPSKKQYLDPLSVSHPDPRLLNKYNLDSRAPFIIHMENLVDLNPRSPPLSSSKDQDGRENKTKDSDLDKEKDTDYSSKKNQRSTSGTYGTIAFGKRILRHIAEFKFAFDLKTIGRNKFSVSFSDGITANKFADAFNKNLSQAFPGEIWIAFVPNFKVIRQYIIRGVDDDDSPEELIANIRPPPDWEMMWSHPFEISRLKRSIRSRNIDNTYTVKYIDSDSYLIRFRATQVPPSVIYMGKRLALIPYVQKVIRCLKCQRFGHLTKICRTPDAKAVCKRCGELSNTHKNGICQADSPSCINCRRNKLNDLGHEASDNSCPIFIKQKQIKKTMAYYNISQAEAETLINASPSEVPLEWSRPPRGVPLSTLRDFLPHNLMLNKQPFSKTYADAIRSPSSTNSSTQPPSSFTLASSSSSPSPSHSPPVPPHTPNYTYPFSTLHPFPSPISPAASASIFFPPLPFKKPPSPSSSSTPSTPNKPKSIIIHKDNNNNNNLKKKKNRSVHFDNVTDHSPAHKETYQSNNSLAPQPEFIDAWIDQCKAKFTSLKLVHRDVLTEMGLTLLNNSLCS